jgi:K+-transporting ATPase A subunit
MTNYNVKSLREQGVKTIEENIEAEKEKKEEEEKTFFDKLQEGLFKYGKIVGIILIVGIIIYFVLLNFGSIKSSLKTK